MYKGKTFQEASENSSYVNWVRRKIDSSNQTQIGDFKRYCDAKLSPNTIEITEKPEDPNL